MIVGMPVNWNVSILKNISKYPPMIPKKFKSDPVGASGKALLIISLDDPALIEAANNVISIINNAIVINNVYLFN